MSANAMKYWMVSGIEYYVAVDSRRAGKGWHNEWFGTVNNRCEGINYSNVCDDNVQHMGAGIIWQRMTDIVDSGWLVVGSGYQQTDVLDCSSVVVLWCSSVVVLQRCIRLTQYQLCSGLQQCCGRLAQYQFCSGLQQFCSSFVLVLYQTDVKQC